MTSILNIERKLSWHLGQLCDQREESRGGLELRPRFAYIYLDRHVVLVKKEFRQWKSEKSSVKILRCFGQKVRRWKSEEFPGPGEEVLANLTQNYVDGFVW